MKCLKLILISVFFSNLLFSQGISDKYQIVKFDLNCYKLKAAHKRVLDTLVYNYEANKKNFDTKVSIKELILTSVLCELEKTNPGLSDKRFKAVKKYLDKKMRDRPFNYKYVIRDDYFSSCDSYDHGVRMAIIVDTL